jgi:hypothetical protein
METMMTENKDDFGGELTDIPEKYQKFFNKFAEVDGIAVEQWKVAHILGYFTREFKVAFQTDYKFKFNSPSPSKCFEVFQVKKLSQLLSSNPKILKEYIDWVFSEKVEKNKKKFRSISFLTGEDNLTEYKMLMLSPKLDRSTLLPEIVLAELKVSNIERVTEIKTFGDAAFIYQAYKDNEVYNQSIVFLDMMAILQKHNITEETLEKIK